MNKFKYKHLVLGGTFDRFHTGHKHLIDFAFNLSMIVSIGVVKANLFQNKFCPDKIESFEIRKRSLEKYLITQDYMARSRLFPIKDIFGTAVKDTTIDAILVTRETHPNALKINKKRRENHLEPLKIMIAPLIKGDDGKVISSGRIRKGEIDKQGKEYFKIFDKQKRLVLPDNLKVNLRIPFGKVIDGSLESLKKTSQEAKNHISKLKPNLIISVGDIITTSLMDAGLKPDIRIFDFKSRREKIKPSSDIYNQNFKRYINPPGTLNRKAAEVIRSAIEKHIKTNKAQNIVILGEEDLLALAAILLSPLGAIVAYGQYDLGVVIVHVTEKKKEEIRKILSQFSPV